MATEKRLIDANYLMKAIRERTTGSGDNFDIIMTHLYGIVEAVPTVDAVEVVRCEKCLHCVNDEEEQGLCKCVESAEYDSESGLWLGFVEYHTPDFFCAFGERKDND